MTAVHDTEYFRPDALAAELRRTFDTCASCRKCEDLCPAFPALFAAFDARPGASAAALDDDELATPADLCHDCKLCGARCPYTAPHPLALDFPGLMQRAKAVRAKQEGISLTDRMLARPDLIGKTVRALGPLGRALSQVPALRDLVGVTCGFHPDYPLPALSGPSFVDWFAAASRARGPSRAEPTAKVVLVVGCAALYGDSAAARAVVQVLWHNDVEVVVPTQVCCGMPLLENGDVEGCVALARQNIAALGPWVERGYDVVVPAPTCSLMLRSEYPKLEGSEGAQRLADRTYDACEFLMRLHGMKKLKGQFGRGPGRVGYHPPPHLRVQGIGNKGRDVLSLIPGTEVRVVEESAMMGETWGRRVETFELAQRYAQRLYDGLAATEADAYASDCATACRQIFLGLGKPAVHPVELLRDAYGLPRL